MQGTDKRRFKDEGVTAFQRTFPFLPEREEWPSGSGFRALRENRLKSAHKGGVKL